MSHVNIFKITGYQIDKDSNVIRLTELHDLILPTTTRFANSFNENFSPDGDAVVRVLHPTDGHKHDHDSSLAVWDTGNQGNILGKKKFDGKIKEGQKVTFVVNGARYEAYHGHRVESR